jgi:hypothetical protein
MNEEEVLMSVVKVIEIIVQGWDDAIRDGVRKAGT